MAPNTKRRPSFTCSRTVVRAERPEDDRSEPARVSLVVYRPLGAGGLPIGIERRRGRDGDRVDLLVPEIRL
jgi:hypothetical protein